MKNVGEDFSKIVLRSVPIVIIGMIAQGCRENSGITCVIAVLIYVNV